MLKEEKLKMEVERFNQAFEVGEVVLYANDFGEKCPYPLKHPAQILSGHTAVCWLEGKTGCVMTSRISKAKETQLHA